MAHQKMKHGPPQGQAIEGWIKCREFKHTNKSE